MYPLVYGDDVDGIVDDGIPENDTSDTSFHIVSITLVLRILVILTEPRRANENHQAVRSFSRRENWWRRGTYPLIPTLTAMFDVVRGSCG